MLTPGTYQGVSGQPMLTVGTNSPSPRLEVHGHGATVRNQADGQAMFAFAIPARIRDLRFIYGPFGPAIRAAAAVSLENLEIEAPQGLEIRGPVNASDITIRVTDADGVGIDVITGSLTLRRGVISGGLTGLASTINSTITVENVIVHTSLGVGINAAGGGSLDFVTVADTGSTSATQGALACTTSLAVRSTILWTPTSNRAVAGACTFSSTIAGPVPAVGAPAGVTNVDPRFVDAAARNYRIRPDSPARDVVDTGPAVDFERMPRPQGLRFDLGADESP